MEGYKGDPLKYFRPSVTTARQDRNMCFTAFRVHQSIQQTSVSSLQQLYIPNDRPYSRLPCVTFAGQDRNICFTAFRVYQSTVQTLFSRLQQLDSTNDGPCSRRPRVTTARTKQEYVFYCILCLS